MNSVTHGERFGAGQFIASICLVVACQKSLHADALNRNFLPIGDRSAFMANTAVADGRSSMAVLFNPGALGLVEKSKISLSGNLYMGFRGDFEPFLRAGNENANVSVSGFNSLPNSAVSIYKWGETTLAASVLVPDYSEVSTIQKISLTNYNAVVVFNGKEQDLWLGLTLARVWKQKFGVGLSVFGTRYTRDTASTVAATVGAPGSTANIAAVISNKGAVNAIQSIFGIFFRPYGWLSTGLKFAAPDIRINGTGAFYEQIQSGATVIVQDLPNQNFYYQRPADLSLGGELTVSEYLRIYLDASLQFPVSFQQMPGIPTPGRYDLQLAPRLSSGFDFRFNNAWSALCGFSWIPSAMSAPEPKYVGITRATNYLTSAGIIYSDAHVRTGLGAFYLYSDGVQQLDSTAGNTGVVRTYGVGALLTSSYEF